LPPFNKSGLELEAQRLRSIVNEGVTPVPEWS